MTSSDDLVRWSPFELIRVAGLATSDSEVYFASVHANPVHGGTLLGLMPLVHGSFGCIGLALSVDGKRWSRPESLKACEVHGERTADHPVAGVALVGRQMVFFLHESVPGATYDQASPARWRTAFSKVGGLDWGTSSLARYSLPCEDFAAWTARSLAALAADGDKQAQRVVVRAPELYVCSPGSWDQAETCVRSR